MKRILLALTVLIYSHTGFCQFNTDSTKTKFKERLKFYPLQLYCGEIRVSYELPIRKLTSVEISPGFQFAILGGELDGNLISSDANLSFHYEFKGFAIRSGFKFYLSSKKGIAGLILVHYYCINMFIQENIPVLPIMIC